LGVDYTTERRKTEREKMFYLTQAHHREKKFCVRKKNFKIFELCDNE